VNAASAESGVAAVVGFGRTLRAAGLHVESRRLQAFRRAAAAVPDDLYWAGRLTLVGRRDELPVYDRVFREHFGGAAPEHAPPLARQLRVGDARALPLGGEAHAGRESPAAGIASPIEVLRRKSFAECSPAELAELSRLIAQLRVSAPRRRSARRRRARDGSPDLRRTLRRALRSGGELQLLSRRARSTRRRRLVLLLDVSGSMSAHARALLTFAHAAVRSDRHFEAFAFGTRLTRLTRALDTARADDAFRNATAAAVDWDGGTRIGDALAQFLDRQGHPGLARGAIVVICSDGLDVGEPAVVAAQMARLERLAHSVVWLNPLAGNPAYEPLARGMAAALPHVDLFASGHDLASLEEVAAVIQRLR
jgi:uncharacterized protein with von Willebrand factor type A (vWA) domain